MVTSTPTIIITASAVCLMLAAFVTAFKSRRSRRFFVDDLDGHDFEDYCAGLLRDNGFRDVKVTPASGDFGADILAAKNGVTYAIQCKRYDKPVGVSAVQEIYAARDYYDRMVGVVITNSDYTEPARHLAAKLNILLWDGHRLRAMSER